MPSMMNNDSMETHALGGNFSFTGTRVDQLGATSYTLATIMVDVTGSMAGHEANTTAMLMAALEACQKSPRSDNLLVRVALFSSRFQPNGTSEVHGFKPLAEIDPASYRLTTGGMTPLCDACYSGLGAANAYAKQLSDQDFLVNAITFVISDGGENSSTATMAMVKGEATTAVLGEILESHVSVLIGINTGSSATADLQRFKTEAGLTQFVDAGDATRQRLAKLAEFVSQSVSSQSQSLGTGGPSQNIAATI